MGITRAVRLAVQSGVMGLGAWLVLENELTGGGMIAASILVSKALAPVEQMVGAWRTVNSGRESWARLRELLAGDAPAAPILSPCPLRSAEIAVEEACVRAADGRALLHDLSLHARARRMSRRRRPIGRRQEHALPPADRGRHARTPARSAWMGRSSRSTRPVDAQPPRRLPAAGGDAVRRHGGREHRPHGARGGGHGRGPRGAAGRRARDDPSPAAGLRDPSPGRRGALVGRPAAMASGATSTPSAVGLSPFAIFRTGSCSTAATTLSASPPRRPNRLLAAWRRASLTLPSTPPTTRTASTRTAISVDPSRSASPPAGSATGSTPSSASSASAAS